MTIFARMSRITRLSGVLLVVALAVCAAGARAEAAAFENIVAHNIYSPLFTETCLKIAAQNSFLFSYALIIPQKRASFNNIICIIIKFFVKKTKIFVSFLENALNFKMYIDLFF